MLTTVWNPRSAILSSNGYSAGLIDVEGGCHESNAPPDSWPSVAQQAAVS